MGSSECLFGLEVVGWRISLRRKGAQLQGSVVNSLPIRLKALIFDLDGTLADTESISMQSWRAAGLELGLEVTDELIHSIVGCNSAEFTRRLKASIHPTEQVDTLIDTANRYYHKFLDSGCVQPRPGAVEIVNWARVKGVRMAVATSSGPLGAPKKLRQIGVWDSMEIVCHGNEVTHSKPHPEIYQLALERLGLDPEYCVAIEDSPNGLRSAASAGLRTILVPDIAPVPDEIAALAWRRCESLVEAREVLGSSWTDGSDDPIGSQF